MSELTVGTISGLAANSYVVDVAAGSTLDLSNGAVFPAGNVIQVVQGISTTPVTTNSATFVTTGITASITPSSASNKILIIATGELMNTGSSNATVCTLFRGTVAGTNLSSSGAFNKVYGDNFDRGAISISYLDSPATTSAVTYTVGFRTDNASFTSYALTNPSLGSIVLMEIAG